MNLKKVKRILAAALAVLLAVPTVSYGGVSEVHAEEASDNTADAAEGGEYTLVTEIESIDISDQVWFLGARVPDIMEELPNTLTVHLSKSTGKPSETQPDTNTDEETTEAEEETAAKQDQETQQPVVTKVPAAVEETDAVAPAKVKDTEEATTAEEESEDAAPEAPEEVASPVEAEESEDAENSEPLTVSSVLGTITDAFRPMIVHAASESDVETVEEKVLEKEISWKVEGKPADIFYLEEGTYTFKAYFKNAALTCADNVSMPEIKVTISPANFKFEKDEETAFTGSVLDNKLSGNEAYLHGMLISYVSTNSNVSTGYSADSVGTTTIEAKCADTVLASYTLHVISDEDTYTVDNNGGEWTRGPVYVTAKDGYLLKETSSDTWKSQLEVSGTEDDTDYGTIDFQIMHEASGAVSNLHYVDWKLDTEAPELYIQQPGEGYYWSDLKDLSSYYFTKAQTTILDTYEDSGKYGSGLKSLQYSVFSDYAGFTASEVEKNVAKNGGWITYNEAKKIQLGVPGNYVVYARAEDNAGNISYANSPKYVIEESEPEEPENPTPVKPQPTKPELKVSVSGIKAQTYTGKAITPKVTVKDASTGKKLAQNKQYKVSYENNINAGTGTVVLTGINGYSGEKRVNFTIQQQNMAKKVQLKVVGKKFLYTGEKVTPPVSVKYNKMTLAEGRDYTVSYSNNIYKGTAFVTITGTGNYTGTKTVKFKIAGPKIKDAEVSLTADSAVYSGANSFPSVVVKYNNKTCQEGVDYIVKYPKKLKAGKNVITISGKGNLSGSVKRNFMVTKAPMSSVEVTLQSSYKLTGKSLKVLPTSMKLNGNALTKKDYTIKYRSLATGKMMSSIKTAGSYQLVLTGKGCYQGTKTVDFTVTGATESSKPANSTTQAKPSAAVTGVGDVVDGMQLVQKYYDGIAMEDGRTVRFEVELDDADDYTPFVLQDCENQMFVGEDAIAPKSKDHYTIHMAEIEYENLNTAVRFTMKIKMDGVKEGTPVYGLWSNWDRGDKTFDWGLKAVAHDGYIEITREEEGKPFKPYGIYIAVEK